MPSAPSIDGGFNVHSEVDADYMPLRNKDNDYLRDRSVQLSENFTGIDRRLRTGRRHPGQQGADPGPHQGASRPDRHRRRRVPQAGDGHGPPPRRRASRPAAALTAQRYAVRSGGWIAAPDKDLGTVMAERFGHDRGYIGNQYGLGE